MALPRINRCTDLKLYGQPLYLFGILLIVFCRSDLIGTHMHHFRKFELTFDRYHTGCKGIVACRFSLFDRSFCCINCHLRANHANTGAENMKCFEKRMKQIDNCWEAIHFCMDGHQTYFDVSSHSVVLLFGDTNMRLMAPQRNKTFKFNNEVMEQVSCGQWDNLM